eukprot:scaffold2640_cov376-Prasinococcus_capsulatus_cf.AAC.4
MQPLYLGAEGIHHKHSRVLHSQINTEGRIVQWWLRHCLLLLTVIRLSSPSCCKDRAREVGAQQGDCPNQLHLARGCCWVYRSAESKDLRLLNLRAALCLPQSYTTQVSVNQLHLDLALGSLFRSHQPPVDVKGPTQWKVATVGIPLHRQKRFYEGYRTLNESKGRVLLLAEQAAVHTHSECLQRILAIFPILSLQGKSHTFFVIQLIPTPVNLNPSSPFALQVLHAVERHVAGGCPLPLLRRKGKATALVLRP